MKKQNKYCNINFFYKKWCIYNTMLLFVYKMFYYVYIEGREYDYRY